VTWRKSSYSGGNCGNCIEVGAHAGADRALVCDTKDRTGPGLAAIYRPAQGGCSYWLTPDQPSPMRNADVPRQLTRLDAASCAGNPGHLSSRWLMARY
jgi:hypothetical protein